MSPLPKKAALFGMLVVFAAMAVGPMMACAKTQSLPIGVSLGAPSASATNATLPKAASPSSGGASSESAQSTRRDASSGSAVPPDCVVIHDMPEGSSDHLAGQYALSICANAAARAALSRGEIPFPEGAVFAASHRTANGEPGPAFVMTKRVLEDAKGSFGSFEYAIVDSRGTPAKTETIGLCARCHDEAPTDHVFTAALPRQAPAKPSP